MKDRRRNLEIYLQNGTNKRPTRLVQDQIFLIQYVFMYNRQCSAAVWLRWNDNSCVISGNSGEETSTGCLPLRAGMFPLRTRTEAFTHGCHRRENQFKKNKKLCVVVLMSLQLVRPSDTYDHRSHITASWLETYFCWTEEMEEVVQGRD